MVEGLIHATTTLVYGLSEAGKSWLMVDLVAAVVRGEKWLGRAVNAGPRRCLVLPSDSGGQWEYAERLGDSFADGVLLHEPPPVDPDAWSALARAAVEAQIGLAVIDNLYSWAGAVDMNSNAEVSRPLACLGALAREGIAVVLVHHTNAGGRKPAGVHAIPAYFRHSLEVRRDGLRSHGNDAATASYWLTRDGGRVQDGGRQVGSRTVEEKPNAGGGKRVLPRHQEAVAALQEAGPPYSERALARHLMASMPSVSTEEAGRSLVKAVRAKGLWAPPRRDREALTAG
ncbi:AAA family ATPase [Modestobacter sp. SYSU DS0657]